MTLREREVALPRDLSANPRLSQWVSADPDGTVAVRVGKVGLGQGVVTALAEFAADELDVEFTRIRMVPLSTVAGPDEGLTAGVSQSASPVLHCGRRARRFGGSSSPRRPWSSVYGPTW